ncbi:fructose-1,6-bisphosphatase, cytosolic isoform X2 [Malus sylvestris]|uniref:fructose-1,6-bisphosphatase, cytosolic isoform X2 n=1 Tax=Malus sylvestris TaxID=3752 RepID=UPI0021AC258C|nr:fructose-1,6-bisphosphatase, cytosolic isoform X2 [Malus sylvestris]
MSSPSALSLAVTSLSCSIILFLAASLSALQSTRLVWPNLSGLLERPMFRVKSKRNWMFFQMKFLLRLWLAVAEPLFLFQKKMKRRFSWSQNCVESTVLCSIHWMVRQTLIVVFPLERITQYYGAKHLSYQIFGIYVVKDGEPSLDDVLQPGKNMVAAGYCMYGSSCTLVISTGSGAHGFTLDPSLGEFILTHPDIQIPKKGKIYSVNEGNAKNWDGPTAKYVQKCKYPEDGSSPKSLRYIGSMVADVHRTLLYGGIFLYPADKKSPNGKLRVLYEVFPMSFLLEQAGGQSFTGKERALDLVPTKIHERSPIFLGSYDDVEEIKALYAAEGKE